MKHIWFGKCECGNVYECPDGKTECCGVLTTLVKDAKGTPFKAETKEIGRFIDVEFDLFKDIDTQQKKDHYYNVWKNENKKVITK